MVLPNVEDTKSGKGFGSSELCSIQQRNCETETLRVFRLITGQVFGRLLEENVDNVDGQKTKNATHNVSTQLPGSEMELTANQNKILNGGTDLKEHVVGILFSQQKLTHLQKQVCSHIVKAIRKEATRIREEWENSLCSGSTSNVAAAKTDGAGNAFSAGANASGPSLNILDHEGPATLPDTYCFEMLAGLSCLEM